MGRAIQKLKGKGKIKIKDGKLTKEPKKGKKNNTKWSKKSPKKATGHGKKLIKRNKTKRNDDDDGDDDGQDTSTDVNQVIKSDKHNKMKKRLSLLRSRVTYEKYVFATLRTLKSSIESMDGEASSTSTQASVKLVRGGLDREANLSRVGIWRAEKNLIDVASSATEELCRKICDQIVCIMYPKLINTTTANRHVIPRVKGKHVELAIANLGYNYFFANN